MKRVAIVYWSQHGQTQKIATRLQETLMEQGLYAQTFRLLKEGDFGSVPIDRFDAAVIGAPVYVGRFPTLIVEWARKHQALLTSMPTALFTVSLNAADTRPEARKEDARLIDEFVQQCGFKPAETASLIGAVHYTKYGLIQRWMLKRICGAAGGPTDTTRNHELTDWVKVADFALDIADLVERSAPTRKATTYAA